MKFDQKYNHDAFAAFLRDFLPEDYVENEKDIADLSRCKIISKARELGHAPSLDVYVLEMTHAKETDPRVSIATDAFKILATFGYDKALVIFKNDESENYRFSYLTISLDLNEKGKVAQKYSNARRYSFYLGTGAKTKTPEQQLVKRGRVKDVGDLLSRFSLEVVNKQFYLEIAKFFDELVDEQDANLTLPFQSDPTVRKNFAMRLIGRLMFCWFLKQKKSNDGALVPDELLSAKAVKDGYYHAILEPLFFEILNTQIDERDIRSDVYDKVPYLNGGLFSPQHDDYYELDRATFTSRHINTLRVADAWFKAFFELLETYNFTIDENTVFDQELSVDPEMLGRIFENLLAEINPDTGSSERKRTGSYYTPRQVVEYMVDQSLTEYLKTATGIDEKRLAALVSYDLGDDEGNQLTAEENKKVVAAIENLKILDPACGSGAFPIGALQKIVWILQRVDPHCDLWLGRKLEEVPELYRKKITDYFQNNPPDYIRKLDVIKDSIFGVDIQPIAVEMSRLRCFLTLVVESEINDAKKNRGIEPLPNLDFKFVCANTLVGLPKKGSNGLFEDHSGIEELSAIMSDYFSATRTERESIKNRFHNKQKELLNRMIERRAVGDLTLKLTNWEPFENKPSAWFDPQWMFGMDEKFDIVVANPPYINTKRGIEESDKEIYKSIFVSAQGQFDLFTLFIERALELTENAVAYIVPKPFINSENYAIIRKMVLDAGLSKVVVGSDVFEAASVESCIFISSKLNPSECVSILKFEANTFVTRASIEKKVFYEMPFNLISDELSSEDVPILKKLRNLPKFGDYVEITRGVEAGKKDGSIGHGSNKLLVGENLSTWHMQYENLNIDFDSNDKKKFKPIELYKQPKILIRRVANELIATLDYENHVVLNTIYCGVLQEKRGVSLKFLVAVLNSRLIKYWFHKVFAPTDKLFPYIRKSQLDLIPIKISNSKAEQIEVLVDKILALSTSDQYLNDDAKQQQVAEHEKQMDELVFDIYELTDEEKGIVRKA